MIGKTRHMITTKGQPVVRSETLIPHKLLDVGRWHGAGSWKTVMGCLPQCMGLYTFASQRSLKNPWKNLPPGLFHLFRVFLQMDKSDTTMRKTDLTWGKLI